MEFLEVVESRRSVRKFSNQPLENEKINQIIECARLAPSWKNQQCWQFVIASKNEIKERLAEALPLSNKWVSKAPIVIVACGDPSKSGQREGIDYYLVDVSIAMEQLVLGAANLGIGTCWIGIFDEMKLKEILNIPENFRVVAMTPLGYSAEKMAVRGKLGRSFIKADRRKSLEEIVHREKW